MPKIMVSLAQRRRSIFYYKYDRSTQSLDPEVLKGRLATARIPQL